MAEFKINGHLKVKTLKELFFNEFEGTLRVYDGKKLADDEATLASIRSDEGAKGGEFVCRASRTVGKFEEEIKTVFGITVQVATRDNWVLVLDGITLSKIKDIPNYATKEVMEEFVSYKRKDVNNEKTQEDVSLEEESSPDDNQSSFYDDIINSMNNKPLIFLALWDGENPGVSLDCLDPFDPLDECYVSDACNQLLGTFGDYENGEISLCDEECDQIDLQRDGIYLDLEGGNVVGVLHGKVVGALYDSLKKMRVGADVFDVKEVMFS